MTLHELAEFCAGDYTDKRPVFCADIDGDTMTARVFSEDDADIDFEVDLLGELA
jgi:hypothetical protein